VSLRSDARSRSAESVIMIVRTARSRSPEYAVKVMALPAAEFIRRFLQHVVPDRFVRVRHFGLLANCGRAAQLARCRELLHQPPAVSRPVESVRDLLLRLTGVDLDRCPVCQQGTMRRTALLDPTGAAPAPRPAAWDTS
jgi:hypothetical protein